MIDEAIDLARQKRLTFRVMRGQVIDFAITVKNADGSPYDFTDHSAEMFVYTSFSKTDIPEFTVVVTLSPGTINFSHSAITRKKEDFVYQLWITDDDGYRQVWTNGPFLVLNREWNHEEDEDTLTISLNGNPVTLIITPLGGSGSMSGAQIIAALEADPDLLQELADLLDPLLTGGGGGSTWVLSTGDWRDEGIWDDTALWID